MSFDNLDCGVPEEGARTVTPGEGFDSPRHPKGETVFQAIDQMKRDVYLHTPVACAAGHHRWVYGTLLVPYCSRCGALKP